MLDISTELKELYKSNNVPKYYDIYIPLLDLHINSHGTNDKIVHGSFELKESLGSDKDLRFGSCEASEIKFVVADISHDLKGQEITIDQYISEHVVPFGKYKIDSCKKQDDLRYKEIIAYDKLADIDIDVSEWYNSLFPTGVEAYTLKKFRSLLLAHLGIEEIDQTLPNDGMVVEKTIDPTQISGRAVLEATVELNGAFGHINRQGKFVRKVLQPGYGLYPSETLYPSECLYPISETDTTYAHESIIDENVSKAMYQSVHFEEYTVKEIDKLQIRAEENDIGAIVGIGTNAYVIEGNFLVFGKSVSELEQIALNIYGNIAKRPYRPFEANSIGLPYVEVGDVLKFDLDDPVTGYVFQRTLTGIQALQDEYTASGNEEREQNFGVNTEIINLKGRYNKTKKDVDGVIREVGNLESRTETKFEQTDQKISLEAQRAIGAEGTLSGQVEVLAGQVVLKADANGNIAAVELDADASEGSAIKIKADGIGLEGLITANGNFKILMDGSMEAKNGKFTGDIISSSITGTTFIQTGSKGTVRIADGGIVADVISSESIASGFVSSTGGMSCTNIQCNTINTYAPIHSGNIGSQSVEYAKSAGIANYAQEANDANHAGVATTADGLNAYGSGAVYVSANGNLRPSSDGGRACGTSEARWSSVWAVSGTILTSDERQKEEIVLLEDDERFARFAKMIVPYAFKMKAGTSGRRHTGFIAQRIEEAMIECEISSMEFAGLIKAPVYAKNLLTDDGEDTGEYDTTSEIIDYTYHLRYEEFIPLIFLWLRELNLDKIIDYGK